MKTYRQVQLAAFLAIVAAVFFWSITSSAVTAMRESHLRPGEPPCASALAQRSPNERTYAKVRTEAGTLP